MSTYNCLHDIVYIWTVQQVTCYWCMAQHLPLMVTCAPPTSLLAANRPTNHSLAVPHSPLTLQGKGAVPSCDWWVCLQPAN